MVKVIVLILFAVFYTTVAANPVIDQGLLKRLQHERVNIILSMKETTSDFVKGFKSVKFASRSQRLNTIVSAVKSFTSASQKPVRDFLESQKHLSDFKILPFFSTNAIVLRNADYLTVKNLLNFESIATIAVEKTFKLEETVAVVPSSGTGIDDISTLAIEWGVARLQAPEVWALGNRGEGAVVGNIGTGVRYTHEALRSNWREDYGWLDPVDGSELPNDGIGVSTHSIGSSVGGTSDQGIGVAPGASWIACKGCSFVSCSLGDLLTCGEFMACPTDFNNANPNCTKAPHVVNNIWGGSGGDPWFNDMVDLWRSLNIIPVFTAGGSGPTCGIIGSPGDNVNVFTAGSTDVNDIVGINSGRGPVSSGGSTFTKPNAVAPGLSVVSATSTSDTDYAMLSGSGTTSSASYAAGVFALLRAAAGADSDISGDQIISAVHGSCDPVVSAGNYSCGGIPDEVYPNHSAGYGILNVLKAVQSLGNQS